MDIEAAEVEVAVGSSKVKPEFRSQPRLPFPFQQLCRETTQTPLQPRWVFTTRHRQGMSHGSGHFGQDEKDLGC